MGKIFVGKFLCASLVMLTCVSIFALHNESFGQQSQRSANERWAEIRRLTAEDHKRMMDLLGIKSLRPGRDGMNPKADNYANYDESKANPYPNLPDPLVLKNGQKVTTAQMWWDQRRPEIVEDFDREIYGRVPKDTPRVDWEVISTTNEKNGGVPVITKELVGHVDNSSCPSITVDIQLTLTTPANAAAPVPVIMEFGFGGRFGGAGPGGGLTWQQQVLAKGWGYAIIVPNSVQADYGAGLIQGIIGLCNKGQPRKADDWGALRAWAWGASRALDYFETDKSVDARQVGLEGHSRYGKATLVAMAYDQRFAIAFISSSGAGGASLFRRDYGEIVENLAGSGEYHWMAGNFLKYAGPLTWDDLPIDAHELVALCAPRPVFISSGSNNGDAWVDAKGMFLAAAGAGPVYKLLGKKDMGTNEFPPIETTLIDGDVAFRQHSGGHTPGPNWPTFLTFAQRYLKVNQTRYLDFFNSKGSFRLVQKNRLSTLYVDSQDYAGVVRAVRDLQADIKRVTGLTPKITHEQTDLGTNAVIVGTIGKSPIIDRLIRDHKIDVAQIAGKWESFLIEVVPEPLPGVASGLIIAGSDKRGTIYGVYDLSGQIGVSPWYWWADVPVKYNDTLFVKAGRYVQGPPAVKYRGIFLNDEEPALGRWAVEKYGGFNHELYEKVFELILRMKGNYLWPAMWWASFNSDDPLNPKLADEYGIVMGTTHHEPMMRAHAEWRKSKAGAWNYETNAEKLRQFWTEGIRRMGSYESIVTLAMRGDGDEAMSEETNIALLEKIVADQRKILADVTGKDVTTIPQLWALYKEVQDYYDKGMRVPEDVTLLLCDDNWGNVRRLPRPGDPPRSGGYGMYYHFDFVGGPRNYKWVNTNPIARVWEQMHLCYRHGVDRIWLVNVGDLKPMEFPIEFFLDYAWNPDQWPAESLPEYTRLWAEQQFGPEHAPAIAEILSKYTKYNSRRKPEMLDSDTYSLIHYREAETVVSDYNKLAEEAERINKAIPPEYKDAYYQLVLHPVTACANLNELRATCGKNHLYAKQGRAAANDMAKKAKELFAKDQEISHYYNKVMAGGKWNHMMDQTHISYTSWQQPEKDVMPEVKEIEIPAGADIGVSIEGSDNWWPMEKTEAVLPEFDPFNQQKYYLEVFNRGQTPFDYKIESEQPWLKVTPNQGKVDKEQRVWVSIDWKQAPNGTHRVPIIIAGPNENSVVVQAVIKNPAISEQDHVRGFVESNGYVSIEAEHYTKAIGSESIKWLHIPNLGRTLSGITPEPVTAKSRTPGGDSPRLEYRLHLFSSGKVNVKVYLSPTQNFHNTQGLRCAVSFDDQTPQIVNIHEKDTIPDWKYPPAWEKAVGENIKVMTSEHVIEEPGGHVLKFWMVDPGIVLQKIIIDNGGVKPSYLGPPESFIGRTAGASVN